LAIDNARRAVLLFAAMKTFSVCILSVVAAVLGGCVDRELTITTDPPDAQVFVSDVEKGRSPVTFPFTWYGDYDIIIRKQGFQTLKTHAHINTPGYQYPPVDFLSELAPWWIVDRRYVHFKLTPATQPSDQELIDRAKTMHKRNLEPAD